MRSRNFAIIFCIILGIFGVHRFYLGQPAVGFTYLILCLMSLVLTVTLAIGIFGFLILGALVLADLISLIAMDEGKFNAKYNSPQKEVS